MDAPASAINTLARTLIDAVDGAIPTVSVEPASRPGEVSINITVKNDDVLLEAHGCCWIVPAHERLGITLFRVIGSLIPWHVVEFTKIPPAPFFEWAENLLAETGHSNEITQRLRRQYSDSK